MSGALVSAAGLGVSFGRRRVLESVSLDVAAGESVVITGRSGSGKTTLLLALAGLIPPSAGRVSTGAVVYVPQAPSLIPELTALENVTLAQRLRGTQPGVADERAQTELARVGLGDDGDALPSQLSGGMAQRTALARALALDPPGLLLDEPTGALDAATGAMVLDLLLERAAQGTSVVVATHDAVVVERLREAGARALVLADGELLG